MELERSIEESEFGRMRDGQLVKKFTFKNPKTQFSFSVLTYGTVVQEINLKDKHGQLVNVSLGFDEIEGDLMIHFTLVSCTK